MRYVDIAFEGWLEEETSTVWKDENRNLWLAELRLDEDSDEIDSSFCITDNIQQPKDGEIWEVKNAAHYWAVWSDTANCFIMNSGFKCVNTPVEDFIDAGWVKRTS